MAIPLSWNVRYPLLSKILSMLSPGTQIRMKLSILAVKLVWTWFLLLLFISMYVKTFPLPCKTFKPPRILLRVLLFFNAENWQKTHKLQVRAPLHYLALISVHDVLGCTTKISLSKHFMCKYNIIWRFILKNFSHKHTLTHRRSSSSTRSKMIFIENSLLIYTLMKHMSYILFHFSLLGAYTLRYGSSARQEIMVSFMRRLTSISLSFHSQVLSKQNDILFTKRASIKNIYPTLLLVDNTTSYR